MSRLLYSDLSWLRREPSDARTQVRALAAARPDAQGVGRDIMTLAGHALGGATLAKLGATAQALHGRGVDLAPLTRFRLGVIGTGTLDLLVPIFVGTALRHGIVLECVVGEYGRFAQEALEPGSTINRAECDAVLLALDYRNLPIRPEIAGRDDAVSASLALIDKLRGGLRRFGGAPTIVQTFAPPPETMFGSFDRRFAGSLRAVIAAINAALVDGLGGSGDLLLDVATLAETVGAAEWHSPGHWNLAKLPFAPEYSPLYADHLGRLLGAMRGKSRRCLIMDLDNTLWGGVIGDDGLDGIKLGQGDAIGEAFLEVQRVALMLRHRGVVLAVSSKNDDAVARTVFRTHPETLLREQDIAIFQANWHDKASNIRAIAQKLDLDLLSIVFLDDNPVERALVRRMLPEVAVPELPEEPALFARTLLAAGYFETIAYSDEDKTRADFYRDNARRVALATQSEGIDEYLQSLEMEISFARFDAVGRQRIAQLVNKSNQFNLTTRRYSEVEIAGIEADPDAFTLQVRLKDIFSDNGMISVVIAKTDPSCADAWIIDIWLMSCRVLGRKVEQAVLREIVEAARAARIRRLVGHYIPSGRNEIVRDHYAGLGFVAAGDDPGGGTRWTYDTDCVLDGLLPMTVRRS